MYTYIYIYGGLRPPPIEFGEYERSDYELQTLYFECALRALLII